MFPFIGFSSGRAPETKALGLDKLGVELNTQTGKIVVGPDESTSLPNVYALGDISEVGMGLTAGTLLITIDAGESLYNYWF